MLCQQGGCRQLILRLSIPTLHHHPGLSQQVRVQDVKLLEYRRLLLPQFPQSFLLTLQQPVQFNTRNHRLGSRCMTGTFKNRDQELNYFLSPARSPPPMPAPPATSAPQVAPRS